jgi:hypothetical protein
VLGHKKPWNIANIRFVPAPYESNAKLASKQRIKQIILP